MKRSRFTGEQIIAILREQEAGAKTADVCRRHGISEATFYAWKAIYGPPLVCKGLVSDGRHDLHQSIRPVHGALAPLAMMGSARPRPS
jgi:Transposase